MTNRRPIRIAFVILSVAAVFVLSACLRSPSTYRQNASVVDFLFPKDAARVEEPAIPTLHLPVNVGVAFVPVAGKGERYSSRQILSEFQRSNLLQSVAKEFEPYKFVKRIEVIASDYLHPGGSFPNLDQIAQMFDVEVIALISYDQMQFTDIDFVSFAYWTIVGAYVIEGEKNETQTMLDAVVYDVPSRTLLFRAPGISKIKARSTPVNISEEMRQDSHRGFTTAATNLVSNLQGQLAQFQERVRSQPERVRVVARPGYTGGGSFSLLDAGILLLLVAGSLITRNSGQPLP